MLELNHIYCGDSLELMKQIPDKSIDLVLTDPPYGLGIDGQKLSICKNPKHNRKEHKFMGWDNDIPSKEYFSEMKPLREITVPIPPEHQAEVLELAGYFPHHKGNGWIFGLTRRRRFHVQPDVAKIVIHVDQQINDFHRLIPNRYMLLTESKRLINIAIKNNMLKARPVKKMTKAVIKGIASKKKNVFAPNLAIIQKQEPNGTISE